MAVHVDPPAVLARRERGAPDGGALVDAEQGGRLRGGKDREQRGHQDQEPGHLPVALGPIHATLLREGSAQIPDSPWRFAESRGVLDPSLFVRADAARRARATAATPAGEQE